MTPEQQFQLFEQVDREHWANAEQRLFAGSKVGRKAQYLPATRTNNLCLEVHKPANVSKNVIELNPISNTGKIDKDRALPFDVVIIFLHSSQVDIARYIRSEGTIRHLCESPSCANICHISIDSDLVQSQREQTCKGQAHTLDFNPLKNCPHLPKKCFFPLA